MSLLLVEASKYSNDVLQRGVVELFVKDDPILERLKFKDIKGNGLTYNVEKTMSTAQFYNVNEQWVEKTSEVEQHTAYTKIMGGDADVDNFLKATRSNVQDLMQEQIAAKLKAIRWTFNETVLYGYALTETKKFDGIQYLLRSGTYNTVPVGNTGSPQALSLMKVEEALDMIKNGKGDVILMTKLLRRRINKALNAVGGITKAEVQGKTVQTLFDLPIVVSDYLSDHESCDYDYGSAAAGDYGHDPTDGTPLGNDEGATTIFVVQFADNALCGVQSIPITTEKFDKLEGKDGQRTRIRWYPSIMVQSIITMAKTTGIDPNTAVTV